MLSVVDGVEQLQSFFGQYVPQLAIAALTPLAMFAIIGWWDVPVAARDAMFRAGLPGPAGSLQQFERRVSIARRAR